MEPKYLKDPQKYSLCPENSKFTNIFNQNRNQLNSQFKNNNKFNLGKNILDGAQYQKKKKTQSVNFIIVALKSSNQKNRENIKNGNVVNRKSVGIDNVTVI